MYQKCTWKSTTNITLLHVLIFFSVLVSWVFSKKSKYTLCSFRYISFHPWQSLLGLNYASKITFTLSRTKKFIGMNHLWYVPNRWLEFEEICMYHNDGLGLGFKVDHKVLLFYMLLIFFQCFGFIRIFL